LLGAAAGLAAGSYLLAVNELLVLATACVVLLMAGAVTVSARRDLVAGIDARREVRPERLHVGANGRVDVIIDNRSGRPAPSLRLSDGFDEGRRVASFVVAPLAPGAVARAAYRVPTRRRGRYVVGPLIAAVHDPFELVQRSWIACTTSEIVVRPRLHDLAAPPMSGRGPLVDVDATTRSASNELGDEFLTLRRYEMGDDVRLVHWRSTARTGELMLRQNAARWRSQAVVVLDTRTDAHSDQSFEVAVEATASVFARLVRQRRLVEVLTSAGEHVGIGGDRRHDVLDRLATVTADGHDHLALVLATLRAHRTADLVVLVLGELMPGTENLIARLGGIPTVTVLTAPGPAVPPRPVVVDASTTPFATAWNHTFSTSDTRTDLLADDDRTRWSRAHARSRRSPSPR
jgi:uncharacterized protein (DUF58 family)